MIGHTRTLPVLAMALAVVAVAACTEAPTELGETQAVPAPTFDFANAPVTSGPFVVRFESGFGIGFLDEDRQLLGLHLLDDSFVGCRDKTAESERLTVQAILEPTGEVQFLARSDAAFVGVFDVTGLAAFPPFCDFVADRLIAEGFSTFTLTENDFFDSGTRRRTFSFKGNGQLENLLGDGEVSYNMHVRLLERDDGGLDVLVQDVLLSPDPR
ncbi:MAG: hypothetical protein ACOC83_05675 [Gemmatimonadota bacterium]